MPMRAVVKIAVGKGSCGGKDRGRVGVGVVVTAEIQIERAAFEICGNFEERGEADAGANLPALRDRMDRMDRMDGFLVFQSESGKAASGGEVEFAGAAWPEELEDRAVRGVVVFDVAG